MKKKICNEENKLCENILLYSDGSIPFFDTDETGYFDENGEKTTISTLYLVEDVDENYITIIEKETGKTYFMSVQTHEIEKKIEDGLLIYNSFYIKCPGYESDEYQLLDKNFNEIISSNWEPRFLGNNFITFISREKSDIYYYDINNIKLIDEIDSYNFVGINAPSSDIKEIGESIYSNLS